MACQNQRGRLQHNSLLVQSPNASTKAKARSWNRLTKSNHLAAYGHVRQIESAPVFCFPDDLPLSWCGTASADVRYGPRSIEGGNRSEAALASSVTRGNH